MKTRLGFVSNSSSSSFIIGFKGNTKPTKELLLNILKVPKDSPIYFIAKKIAEFFLNEIKSSDKLTKKFYLDEYDYLFEENYVESEEERLEIIKNELYGYEKKYFDKILSGDYSFYIGMASSESGGIESLICDLDLDIETEDFILQKAGGY